MKFQFHCYLEFNIRFTFHHDSLISTWATRYTCAQFMWVLQFFRNSHNIKQNKLTNTNTYKLTSEMICAYNIQTYRDIINHFSPYKIVSEREKVLILILSILKWYLVVAYGNCFCAIIWVYCWKNYKFTDATICVDF